MIKLNAIPIDYEPRKKIFPKLAACANKVKKLALMSEFESAFLCGMLKACHPKKILEVGIEAGGSTAIILQALEDIGEPYEMHSTDINVDYWDYPTEKLGFLATFAKENNLFTPPQSTLCGTHEVHLGKFLPQIIDSIGGDIDFVILDTVHKVPGEGLDFLAMLPYLKNDAVVVLHDVALNHFNRTIEWHYAYATGIVFSAVTAEKFLNFQPDDETFRYPNIAAFKVNEQTREHIDNLFLSMILTWDYLPTEEELIIYRNHYRRFYPAELCEIFQEAIDMNVYDFYIMQRK